MADSRHFVAFEQVSTVLESLTDDIITFIGGKSYILKIRAMLVIKYATTISTAHVPYYYSLGFFFCSTDKWDSSLLD